MPPRHCLLDNISENTREAHCNGGLWPKGTWPWHVYNNCIHNYEQMAREANEKIEKFEMKKCIEWEEKIIDYLSSVYNTRDLLLIYVVGKEWTKNVADVTREEEILHHTSLNGPMFGQYSKNLMRIIKELTIGTPERVWIKQFKCGCVAMHKLRGKLWWQVWRRKSKNTGKEGAREISLSLLKSIICW